MIKLLELNENPDMAEMMAFVLVISIQLLL